MSYSIMLDAGHGGRDPGAVYNGRREKDDTLSLTLAIGELLQERGIDVLYTRTTDIYESPYQKALEANAAGADFFLSIHRNSYPTDNTVSGVESLVYNKSGLKYTMAQNINEGLEALGFINLGVKERPGLVVLRRTQMPAVLVEVGFINSDTDNRLFDNNFDDILKYCIKNKNSLKEYDKGWFQNEKICSSKEYDTAIPVIYYEYNPNKNSFYIYEGIYDSEGKRNGNGKELCIYYDSGSYYYSEGKWVDDILASGNATKCEITDNGYTNSLTGEIINNKFSDKTRFESKTPSGHISAIAHKTYKQINYFFED